MRKNAREERTTLPSADQARGSTAAEGIGSPGRITEAERNAQPDNSAPAPSATEGELGGRPGVAFEAEAAAGLGDVAGEQEQRLTGAQLLDLCDMSKGLLVRLLGNSWKLDAVLVEKLAPINPATRSLLSNFADQAAQYLPAANANAPLIGALAFAGLLAGDLFSTWSKLKADRQKAAATEERGTPVLATSPVIGAEDIVA